MRGISMALAIPLLFVVSQFAIAQDNNDQESIDWEQRTHESLQIHQRRSRQLNQDLQEREALRREQSADKLQQTREQYADELRQSAQQSREKDRQRIEQNKPDIPDPAMPNLNDRY